MGRKPSPKAAEYAGTDDWVGRAWRDYCQGLQNYAELGRKYGHKPHTVKANLIKYSANRAAECEGGIDPTAEYIDGLLVDLGAATNLYLTGDNDNAKLGGLKLRVAIREKLAGGKGVITKRESVLYGQDPNRDPIEVLLLHTSLDELTEVARNGDGSTHTDDSGTGDSGTGD